MDERLPFFNWSLRRLLQTEPDSFKKAKIRILYTILLFSLAKVLVTVPVVYLEHQEFQKLRILFMLVVYLGLLKLLLSGKRWLPAISHIMVWMGLLIIWSIVFISAQTVNIITIQFVFMLITSSFYLLNNRYGIFYAIMGTAPVILYLFLGETIIPSNINPDGLSSPAYEMIVILNFVTIVISHYLYHHAFTENIREKEALNAQLQVAVIEANAAAQSKSDFLSTMSHELRTPLNSVIGMTELLLDDPHSDDQAENLKVLNFSAVSLHSLINDILDFNKMDSDKLQLESLNVNLYLLIKNICSGLNLQAKEKGLNLELQIDDSLRGLMVVTDPTRITQVIYNLVGNAIKFTSAGNVFVKLTELSREADTVSIRFAIIDSGIGIAEDKQSAIFEPFVQASTSTTREFGGTGLGLAIVKHLLLLFESTIRVESAVGKGATFSFDLGFRFAGQRPEVSPANPLSDYDLKGLKILVAEDNAINRLLMKKVFMKWNNEPVFAADGKETLEKLAVAEYDVILMDIHMPVMDGYETTRAIRESPDRRKAGTLVIALTASVSDNLGEKIRAAGMDDYICKPFNARELYNKLKIIEIEKNGMGQGRIIPSIPF